jgi:hypothetical protein
MQKFVRQGKSEYESQGLIVLVIILNPCNKGNRLKSLILSGCEKNEIDL